MKFKFYDGIDGGVLSVETDEGEKLTFGNQDGAMYPKFWTKGLDSVVFKKSDMPSYLNEAEKAEIFSWAIKHVALEDVDE